MESKHIIFYVLILAVLVMQLVSISTEDWSCLKSLKINEGLWQACAAPSGKKICTDLPPSKTSDPSFPKNALNAARALAIIGLVMVILAVVCKYMYPGHKCCMVLLLLGGLCSVFAAVVWAVKVHKHSKGLKYGYSYWLSLVAGILAVLLSVLICVKFNFVGRSFLVV